MLYLQTNAEIEEIEFFDEDVESIHHARSLNITNNDSSNNSDKENTPNVAYSENNDSYATIKKRKRKSKVEFTSQPTQTLANVAQITYEMQVIL